MTQQNRNRAILTVLILLCGLVSATAQRDLSGTRQYPQFRTISGLSGGGFIVGPDGKLSPKGPIAISIPIAYSLAKGVWMGGLNYTGPDMRPRLPKFDSGRSDFSGNGTAWLMTGFSGGWGRLTAGIMVVSSRFDSAFNLEYTPPNQTGPVTFALGAQDVSGNGGANGQAIDEVKGGNSRSLFATATWKVKDDLYATAGWGSNRFRFGFAGVAYNITSKWSLTCEHDGYNVNAGIAYRIEKLAKVDSQEISGILMLGAIRGKYLNLSFSFGF